MCTSVSVISEDGTHVMGRTMDWYDLYVKPTYVPRGYQWNSAFYNKKYIYNIIFLIYFKKKLKI